MSDVDAAMSAVWKGMRPIEALSLAFGVLRARWRFRSRRIRVGSWPIATGHGPLIRVRGHLVIGDRFRMSGRQFPSAIDVEAGAQLNIGTRVFINQGARIHARTSIDIGDRVEIGDLVAIYDTNFHATEPGAEVVTRRVVISPDCWIGSGATILPGVSLGRGCVVGAGAVVTRSFTDGSLIAGNPAECVRTFPVPADYKRR